MTMKVSVNNNGSLGSIADRAAGFLDVNYVGAHATKRIQRDFGISAGMAKLLRAGKCWTVTRLDQAERLYGKAFRDAVWPPPPDDIREELAEIRRRLDELLGRGK